MKGCSFVLSLLSFCGVPLRYNSSHDLPFELNGAAADDTVEQVRLLNLPNPCAAHVSAVGGFVDYQANRCILLACFPLFLVFLTEETASPVGKTVLNKGRCWNPLFDTADAAAAGRTVE